MPLKTEALPFVPENHAFRSVSLKNGKILPIYGMNCMPGISPAPAS